MRESAYDCEDVTYFSPKELFDEMYSKLSEIIYKTIKIYKIYINLIDSLCETTEFL